MTIDQDPDDDLTPLKPRRDWLSGPLRVIVLMLAFIGLGVLVLCGGCASLIFVDQAMKM